MSYGPWAIPDDPRISRGIHDRQGDDDEAVEPRQVFVGQEQFDVDDEGLRIGVD